MTCFGKFLVDLASELMRVRVECLLIPLIGSIAKHDSLVTSSEILLLLVPVDSRGNVGILCLNNLDHVALSPIKTLLPRIVANSFACVSCDLLEIHLLLRDTRLSHEHEHLALDGTLHSHLRVGVNPEAGVENGIGNLIAEFIWVTFSD